MSTAERFVWCGILLLLGGFGGVTSIGLSAAEPVRIDGVEFQLAEGWSLQRVAAPPLVRYPVCADFAPDGRLFVAESSGSGARVQQQLEERPHRLVCLEDTTGDGHFDRRMVFAEGLMLPQGVLWWQDRVLVATPPEIWEFQDTTGDGLADHRAVWFDGKTLTGCANDLHGPFQGRDGWVYWCKGAFAEQHYERADGSTWSTRAAHIFRRYPASGRVEVVMTGGMDNPVEMAMTLCGERFFTSTFVQHPADGRRDGLVHAIYGGVYGKAHGVLEGHPRTGPLMPIMTHLGPAAPSGLMLRESPLQEDNLLGELCVAQFNLQKISRHRLIRDGSAFRTEDDDLLVADRPDFHPTDVLEDADGSLLVIDTGGWYTLCCPTSHIDQSQAEGAIYRLRPPGEPPEDPRGSRLEWEAMSLQMWIERLGDRRPVVRQEARRRIVAQGAGAAEPLDRALSQNESSLVRVGALGCLSELASVQDAPARQAGAVEPLMSAVMGALDDPDATVQLAAARVLGLYRHRPAAEPLLQWLRDGSPRHGRAAAEALGRIGSIETVPELFEALGRPDVDRPLEHALLYAMIEIGGDSAAVLEGEIAAEDPLRRRAALLVLDQLDSPRLTLEAVLAALQSDSMPLREQAIEILVGRSPWDAAIAERFSDLVVQLTAAQDREGWQPILERLVGRPGLAAAVAEVLERGPEEVRRAVLGALAAAPPSELPEAWAVPLAGRLAEADDSDEILQMASILAAVRWQAAPPERLSSALAAAIARWQSQTDVWLALLAAKPPQAELPESIRFAALLEALGADEPPQRRQRALAALGRVRLEPADANRLAAAVADLGPMELRGVLERLRPVHDRQVNETLIGALEKNPQLETLPGSELEHHFAEHPPELREQAAPLADRLGGDQRAEQAEQLARLVEELPEGDALRGFQIFRSSRAACSACHAVAYHGGRIGPDLTRIGGIRTRTDLLEAIVFPSASFVRSYESMLVLTDDGRALNGILVDEGIDAITLVTGIDQRVRVPRDQIETIKPSGVSIMPAGLDQQLTLQELADLVEFLKTEK